MPNDKKVNLRDWIIWTAILCFLFVCALGGIVWALGDKAVSIAYAGVVYITLNATLAVGALVASDANGKAVAYAAGDYVAGRLMSGGVAGDLASLLLIRAPIDTIV